jgi:hypothetical protein
MPDLLPTVRVLIHIAGVAALLAGALPAQAQDSLPPPIYDVVREHDITGSHLQRAGGRSQGGNAYGVPLNRRYEQLTDGEKAVLRQRFAGLPADAEPPFPAKGLEPLYLAMIKGQQKLGVEGALTLLAEVDEKGLVQQLEVMATPGPEMTNYVAAVLMDMPFKPARCQGQPCTMKFPVNVNFSPWTDLSRPSKTAP